MKRLLKTNLTVNSLAERISKLDDFDVLHINAVGKNNDHIRMYITKVYNGCNDTYFCNVCYFPNQQQSFIIGDELSNEEAIHAAVNYFYNKCREYGKNFLQIVEYVEVQESELLIPSTVKIGLKSQVIEHLTEWIKENGNMPFEHGFSNMIKPMQLKKWADAKVHLIEITSDAKVYVKIVHFNDKVVFAKLPLGKFTKEQLLNIIDTCNEYYLYCKYEA